MYGQFENKCEGNGEKPVYWSARKKVVFSKMKINHMYFIDKKNDPLNITLNIYLEKSEN